MRRRGAALKVWLLAIACVAGLSACKDNGLVDRNLPLEDAQHREFRYAVYQAAPVAPPVAVGGRHWIRSAAVESIPAHVLVPVGNTEGTQLFARRGEQAPYSRLYAQAPGGRWVPYLRLN